MKRTVSEKWQVTIPKALRDRLAIRPGPQLDFAEENGTLVARRVLRVDPLDRLLGVLPSLDVDQALDDLRGAPWTVELDERR